MPFLIPKAPVRNGVVRAFRLRAAAVVDSRSGRSWERLNRLGRGMDKDLMPRLETWLKGKRGRRKGGGSRRQRANGLDAMF